MHAAMPVLVSPIEHSFAPRHVVFYLRSAPDIAFLTTSSTTLTVSPDAAKYINRVSFRIIFLSSWKAFSAFFDNRSYLHAAVESLQPVETLPWENILTVGSSSNSGNPLAFYSQQSSPKLDTSPSYQVSRIK
ncbi:hypothetical protein Tco_1016082 [Tanacetum coccineum]|uniref:Uncharacterized protein n=1 Tax=Tanacetum coccineum TaxID=301880 RepID=A0ABQ5FPH9_9ASTR